MMIQQDETRDCAPSHAAQRQQRLSVGTLRDARARPHGQAARVFGPVGVVSTSSAVVGAACRCALKQGLLCHGRSGQRSRSNGAWDGRAWMAQRQGRRRVGYLLERLVGCEKGLGWVREAPPRSTTTVPASPLWAGPCQGSCK